MNTQSNSELRTVFNQFDVNNDGTIDENELRTVMKNMGQNPTQEEIRAMFKAADVNGDGQITFEGIGIKIMFRIKHSKRYYFSSYRIRNDRKS